MAKTWVASLNEILGFFNTSLVFGVEGGEISGFNLDLSGKTYSSTYNSSVLYLFSAFQFCYSAFQLKEFRCLYSSGIGFNDIHVSTCVNDLPTIFNFAKHAQPYPNVCILKPHFSTKSHASHWNMFT